MTASVSLTVRPATPADEPFLFRLYAGTRADELAATGWNAAQRDAFLRSQFAARQAGYRANFPAAKTFVLLDRRQAIGASIVSRITEEIRIVDIALLPAHRGTGLGTRLLRELMDEASAARKPLRLQVLKNNPALRLYLRLGFAPSGENGLYLKMEWLPAR